MLATSQQMQRSLGMAFSSIPWLAAAAAGNPTLASIATSDFIKEKLVVGVLLVEPGTEYSGPLTPFSPEARIQWHALGSGDDAYTVHVRQACWLHTPAQIYTTSGFVTQHESHLMPVSPLSLQELLRQEVETVTGAQCSLTQLLQAEAGITEMVAGSMPCLLARLPWSIALASVAGQVSELVLLGRWRTATKLFTGFPSARIFRKVPRGQRVAVPEARPLEESSTCLAESLSTVSDFLRSLSSMHVALPPGLDEQIFKAELGSHVALLDRLSLTFQPPVTMHERYKFSSKALIDWLHAASLLRNRSKLKQAVELCVPHVIPVACQEMVRSSLDSATPVPSRESIRRARFLFDGGLAMRARDLFLPQLPLYVGSDSSPQGGANWLLTQVQMLQVQNQHECIALHDALQFLSELCQTSTGAEEEGSDLGSASSDNDMLCSKPCQVAAPTCEADDGMGELDAGSMQTPEVAKLTRRFLSRTLSTSSPTTRTLAVDTQLFQWGSERALRHTNPVSTNTAQPDPKQTSLLLAMN